MVDAHFLYVIMGVVIAGLASWVIAVNIWAPKRPIAPSPTAPAPDRLHGSDVR